MKEIKFALYSIKMNLKNASELKSSFLISIFGMVLNNCSFLVLWYYFGKTVGIINGWKPVDIFGLYGFSGMSFGFISCFFKGIFKLPTEITSANFDKYLTTPKNILLKLATSHFSVSALGDFLYGVICFIIFAIANKFTLIYYLVGLLLVIVASLIFFSFSLICMTISFYLMDEENVSKGFHGMFVSNSLYHGGAFTGVLRIIFMYVVPSLMVSSIPVEINKSLDINSLVMITSLGIVWFGIAVIFFNKSIKKYESNNLFGFGS